MIRLGKDLKDPDVQKVLKRYGKYICIFLVVFILIDLIRFYCGVTFESFLHEFLKICSIVLSIVAVAGNRGWVIQSWNGNTPAERWNNWCVLILIFISGVITLCL